ncbi:MAG TPA: CNNM domain-containing protein, partial [Gammaproteobacteria bacterium]|nr:CNNM domain-containing protein [Gammaproteobacteria bacterium]
MIRSCPRQGIRTGTSTMDTALATVTAIVLLLLANGFFVAAEFALVKARSFRIDALAADGRMGAKLAQKIQRKLE